MKNAVMRNQVIIALLLILVKKATCKSTRLKRVWRFEVKYKKSSKGHTKVVQEINAFRLHWTTFLYECYVGYTKFILTIIRKKFIWLSLFFVPRSQTVNISIEIILNKETCFVPNSEQTVFRQPSPRITIISSSNQS